VIWKTARSQAVEAHARLSQRRMFTVVNLLPRALAGRLHKSVGDGFTALFDNLEDTLTCLPASTWKRCGVPRASGAAAVLRAAPRGRPIRIPPGGHVESA
jgi:class 3 adenylate cyclase